MSSHDVKTEIVSWVNRIKVKSGGKKVLVTWLKGREDGKTWEFDIMQLRTGEAWNEEWFTMDANLEACYEYYKGKDYFGIEDLDEFNVDVECWLDKKGAVVKAYVV